MKRSRRSVYVISPMNIIEDEFIPINLQGNFCIKFFFINLQGYKKHKNVS